jgi:hypothetical protein
VNANPGEGKTFHSNKLIASEYKKGRPVLVVVPSIALMKQVSEDLSNKYIVNSTIISHESVGSYDYNYPVLKQLKEAVQNKERVILITHVTFLLIPKEFHKLELFDYSYIIDEVFNPSTYYQFQLEKSLQPKGILGGGIVSLKPTDNPAIQKIKIQNKKALKDYTSKNRFDSKDSFDISVTKEILTNIGKSSMEALVYKMENSLRGLHCICVRFNVKVLQYARKVTFMSAKFSATEIYHLLKQKFKMVNATKSFHLRDLSHRNKKLTVMPLIEGKVYSKTLNLNSRVCLKKDLTRALKHYVKYGDHAPRYTYTFEQYTNKVIEADSRLSHADTLRVSNLDNPSKVGEAISSRSHGINEYQSHKSIAVIASFNQKPHVAKMSRVLYPNLNQYVESNVLTTVQAICRTAIRDINSVAEISALVSDDCMANSVIEMLDGDPTLGKHCLFDDYTFYTVAGDREKKRVGMRKARLEAASGIDLKTHYKNGKPRVDNPMTSTERKRKQRNSKPRNDKPTTSAERMRKLRLTSK